MDGELAVMSAAFVGQADLVRFAEEKVNLKREDVTEYRDQVNRLREKLDKFIAEHPNFGLVKMLLSGSLAKGIALKTINDIDVVVYVEGDVAPQQEGELLDWLASRLREAYASMDPSQIEPQTHVVRISFRGTGLDVDVGPVHYDGLPDDRGYLIARDTGERVLTSIPLHLKFIRTRKNAQPRHFAQVLRLLKWWVRERRAADPAFRLKSFMVELICAHLADSGTDMSDYRSALESFFSYLVKSQLRQRIAFYDYYELDELPESGGDAIEVFDPVNPENNVARGYDETQRRRIVDAAEDALDALAAARFATTKGEAISYWREVLGPSFMR